MLVCINLFCTHSQFTNNLKYSHNNMIVFYINIFTEENKTSPV